MAVIRVRFIAIIHVSCESIYCTTVLETLPNSEFTGVCVCCLLGETLISPACNKLAIQPAFWMLSIMNRGVSPSNSTVNVLATDSPCLRHIDLYLQMRRDIRTRTIEKIQPNVNWRTLVIRKSFPPKAMLHGQAGS